MKNVINYFLIFSREPKEGRSPPISNIFGTKPHCGNFSTICNCVDKFLTLTNMDDINSAGETHEYQFFVYNEVWRICAPISYNIFLASKHIVHMCFFQNAWVIYLVLKAADMIPNRILCKVDVVIIRFQFAKIFYEISKFNKKWTVLRPTYNFWTVPHKSRIFHII